MNNHTLKVRESSVWCIGRDIRSEIISNGSYAATILTKPSFQWKLLVHTRDFAVMENPRSAFSLQTVDVQHEILVETFTFLDGETRTTSFLVFPNSRTNYLFGTLERSEIGQLKEIVLRFTKLHGSGSGLTLKPEGQTVDLINPILREKRIIQLSELSEDFQKLLKEGHLSDITINCKSKEFKVHKLVLCARSPVFKSMFAHPTQENATNEITIHDLEDDVLQATLEFLYCGQVVVGSLTTIEGLLYTAGKYQIGGLKEGILGYLRSEMSKENALKILELADMYEESFKKEVMEFVHENFSTLRKTQRWADLKSAKPLLALEVYSYYD